jgi:serine/threonine protein kinase
MIMHTRVEKHFESILGYRLISKIGSGGFGEVWKAEAPGGLFKAVKILFGCNNDRRANLELRSLEKIKQLRHPFLLSLERIDFVDELMVIVTELADRSLADVFESYAQKQICGIPRAELLGYLSQAAEALDFLAFEHNLQHLDVKPENFLLVGQHAKLADFGLVKDVQQTGQSLIGGMTPTYAAPELFDGRPSRYSDQYSLAILFQEMLTGERPFGGNSAAQLAAQHMNAKPNLSRLPANDQTVIAKALNKDPEKRFKCCREMIEELKQRKTLVLPGKRHVAVQPRNGSDSAVDGPRSFSPAVTQPLSKSINLQGSQPNYAPAPADCAAEMQFAPLLVVGIGQLGTQILRGVKARIEQQFGDMSQLPSIGLLALDTDRVSISQAVQGVGPDYLSSDQTLHLPLRRPEDYRGGSRDFSKWLNRRWIYNVPKSLQTEGLRPLGRLALVDNFDQVWSRLKQQMERISQPDAIAQTVAQLDCNPEICQPRVFIVGSISGGVGSGTILDLAYLAQFLLMEQGYSGEDVHGVLLHSTESRGRDAGLNIASSFSFLTELRQYMRDGYPGDASCGIPELPGTTPFGTVYLQPLEPFRSDDQLQAKLSEIASYLVISNLTPGQPFFEACRGMDKASDSFSFRSFGMSLLGLSYSGDTQRVAATLIEPILARWCGQSPQAPVEIPDFSELIPPREAWERRFDSLIKGVLPRNLISKALNEALQGTTSQQPDWHVELDKLFGYQDTENPGIYLGKGLLDTAKLVEELYQESHRRIREEVRNDFGSQRLDLNFAIWKWNELQRRQSTQLRESNQQVEKAGKQMLELEDVLNRQFVNRVDRAGERVALGSTIENYFQARYRYVSAVCARELQRKLLRNLEDTRSEVERIRLRISAAIKTYLLSKPGNNQPLDENAELQLRALQRRELELLSKIELRFFAEAVEPRGSFWEISRDAACFQSQLLPAIYSAATQEVTEASRTLCSQSVDDTSDSQNSAWRGPISQLLSKCHPFSDKLGGEARLLLGVPKGNDPELGRVTLREQTGALPAAVNLNSSDLVLVNEVSGISFVDFALSLLCERSDCMELASRLLVRSDVQWSSLRDLL